MLANLGALCVLVAATTGQSANAAGTTAYNCTKTGTPTGANRFSDAHCKSVSNPSGQYFHRAIEFGSLHSFEFTNTTTAGARAPLIIKATVAGTAVVIEAKRVSGSGTLQNQETIEMYAEGSLPFGLTLEEVTANNSCGVSNTIGSVGKFDFQALRVTTKGQGDALKVEPQGGTKLAEFELFGKECILAGKYSLVGSFIVTPEGATANVTHTKVTEAKTLRVNSAAGPVAGVEGSLTMSDNFSEPGIAFTT